MKIGIQTWGSDGDVRPFLALAGGLSSRGHDVTLAYTHIENRDHEVEGRTLGFRAVRVAHIDQGALKAMGEDLIPVRDPMNQIRIILRGMFDPFIPDMFAAARELCASSDLVIGHFLVHPLLAAAEQANIPRISVFLAPILPSGHIPLPGMPDLGRFMNGLLWRIGARMMDRTFLGPINELRKRAGVRPAAHVTEDISLSPSLNLVGSSPVLLPPPPDWRENIKTCGAFVLPAESGTGPAQDGLDRFFADGPPPVYLTIGSMAAGDPGLAETAGLLHEAARLSGSRAIVQFPWDRVDGVTASPDVFRIGRVHHDSIFPRCSAVLHHGGAGTTHAVTRAGKPSVVMAHATDQQFWGETLHRAGLAPRPIDRRKATAASLAAALRTVLASEAMRERARRAGEAMAREDGVRTAVSLIEKRFSGRAG